jgi:cysteine synthase A
MVEIDKATILIKIERLWELVGNTPMIEIFYRYRDGAEESVLVKCEHYNLTGSIKDRMALYILQKAYEIGTIKPGDVIVEATSGNTGIAFASIGKALGHPVKIIMPDWLSKERMAIIESLGAEIQLVSKAQGGFLGSIEIAEVLGREADVFLPRQFANCYNAEAHEQTTAKEIWRTLLGTGQVPMAFVAGVGTGGTIMGVGNFLRSIYPDINLHPVEPAESPTLSTGYKVGSHRIQGISDEFIPEILKLQNLDSVLKVNDGDAILMAQALGRELGLAVGISSGANILAAMQLQNRNTTDDKVVTVFPDDNKKYLSTDLMRVEPVKDSYLSPDIKLTGYHAV